MLPETDNLKDAADAGKSETYLFSEDDKAAFKAFVDGTSEDAKKFMDGEKSYRTRDYFITVLGTMSEADEDLWDLYWSSSIEHYTAPEEEDTGLAWWAWTLIGVSIGIVVIGAGLTIFFVHRAKKNKAAENKPAKMVVDTTDDEDIDVYAENAEPLTEAENAALGEELEGEVVPDELPVEEGAETQETAEGDSAEAEPVAEESAAEEPSESNE